MIENFLSEKSLQSCLFFRVLKRNWHERFRIVHNHQGQISI